MWLMQICPQRDGVREDKFSIRWSRIQQWNKALSKLRWLSLRHLVTGGLLGEKLQPAACCAFGQCDSKNSRAYSKTATETQCEKQGAIHARDSCGYASHQWTPFSLGWMSQLILMAWEWMAYQLNGSFLTCRITSDISLNIKQSNAC